MKPTKLLFPFIILFFLVMKVHAQTEGSFTDSRDGKTYKTVTYKVKDKKKTREITWMAENLNFSSTNSFCVNNNVSNCSKYGRLYTWFEAKKVCPTGWRLPSDKDWYNLANLYKGVEKAGKYLKTKGKNKGNNKSKFNGLLGGAKDASNDIYHRVGTAGFFWSSTESTSNSNEASDWSFASWTDKLRHWEGGKLIGNSCRCVKD